MYQHPPSALTNYDMISKGPITPYAPWRVLIAYDRGILDGSVLFVHVRSVNMTQPSIMYGHPGDAITGAEETKDFAHAYFHDSRLLAAGTCSEEFGTAQS